MRCNLFWVGFQLPHGGSKTLLRRSKSPQDVSKTPCLLSRIRISITTVSRAQRASERSERSERSDHVLPGISKLSQILPMSQILPNCSLTLQLSSILSALHAGSERSERASAASEASAAISLFQVFQNCPTFP